MIDYCGRSVKSVLVTSVLKVPILLAVVVYLSKVMQNGSANALPCALWGALKRKMCCALVEGPLCVGHACMSRLKLRIEN